jgi:ribonuclease BN (tRNA processing enzyme)
MAKLGIGFQLIEGIFLTHFHPDHSSDLIHFLFAKKNPSERQGNNRPVTIAGPNGLKTFLKRLQQAYGHCLKLPEGLVILEEFEIETGSRREYGSFIVSTQSTRHTSESIAYRIEDSKGKSVVFSGDTGFCDEIIELARDADVIFLECSFPEGSPTEGHLTPSLAGRVAQMAGARRLVLTHFYPEVLKTDIVSQCRKTFEGELTLAYDFLQIRI